MICFSDDIVIYVFSVHLVKFLFPFLLFSLFCCLLPYGEIKMNITVSGSEFREVGPKTAKRMGPFSFMSYLFYWGF